MTKKKKRKDAFLKNFEKITMRIKRIYYIVKNKIIDNPGVSINVLIILILLLSLNFMGSCGNDFFKCSYEYNPNIDKLKEVIKND